MNVAFLLGTVSSDITRTPMRDGGSVSRFRLKTVEQYTSDGVLKESTQTHLIDVWNKYLQDNIVPLLRQGQLISIQGSIQSRNLAKQGEPPRWTTTIVLRNHGVITIMGGPNSGMAVRSEARDEEPRVDHSNTATSREPVPVTDGLDDEVPF